MLNCEEQYFSKKEVKTWIFVFVCLWFLKKVYHPFMSPVGLQIAIKLQRIGHVADVYSILSITFICLYVLYGWQWRIQGEGRGSNPPKYFDQLIIWHTWTNFYISFSMRCLREYYCLVIQSQQPPIPSPLIATIVYISIYCTSLWNLLFGLHSLDSVLKHPNKVYILDDWTSSMKH